MIELNDIPEVLELPQEVQVGKLGLEGIGHPGEEGKSFRGEGSALSHQTCTVSTCTFSNIYSSTTSGNVVSY